MAAMVENRRDPPRRFLDAYTVGREPVQGGAPVWASCLTFRGAALSAWCRGRFLRQLSPGASYTFEWEDFDFDAARHKDVVGGAAGRWQPGEVNQVVIPA